MGTTGAKKHVSVVSKIERPHPTTENPELADRFDRVLTETVEAMEEAGIPYLFIGGIASGGLGRPRSTRDIDLFVKPEDAEVALRALAKRGFRTEKTDPSWLYKGFKEDILVDVIFRSKGEIYLDREMYQRMITAEYHGKSLRLVAPEDLLIIKAVAHSELTPGHWHDAIGLLTHASIDWEYLIRRAKRAPRRVLSLLLYAQSNDVWVPNWVIHDLYSGIFGDGGRGVRAQAGPGLGKEGAATRTVPLHTVHARHPEKGERPKREEYEVAHLQQAFAEDPRTHELDIQVELSEGRLLLRGEVATAERRAAVEAVAREKFPSYEIENQVRVLQVGRPEEAEEIE